jgi:hypothetical protein
VTVDMEQEIAQYVARVRAALADLPPAVRDELLEDLPEHLAEVAAEHPGTPLAQRLGPPEAYAVELRTAAGIAASDAAPNLDQRLAVVTGRIREQLRALDRRIGPVIGYQRGSEFLRLLGPAWWVLRGYLFAMLIANMLSENRSGMLPRLGDSLLAALLLLTASVGGSIWLGRRGTPTGRGPRWALHGATAVLVLFAIGAFFTADARIRVDHHEHTQVYYEDPYSHVRDVFVYDGEGRLVENARLLDQDGQVIRLGEPGCDDEYDEYDENDEYGDQGQNGYSGRPSLGRYPYCPSAAPFRLIEPTPHATEPGVSTSQAPVASPTAVASPTPAPSPEVTVEPGATPTP